MATQSVEYVWILTLAIRSVPGSGTVRDQPQAVVSGPEKTVVFWPFGSITSMLVTNGPPLVSKTSIDVPKMGGLQSSKFTSSHECVPFIQGTQRVWRKLALHGCPTTVGGPVAHSAAQV